uniref:Small ribosomal subunit protein uS8c n=1 Tax=Selaginella lepidophylla TaxID=59777 RepID=A0A3Q9R2B6_SELLP|nr:ribosomal protein S8 [Selaginella lepidophylla]AZU95849.1 ribosomal protein S8 [Selaginella lepidophylla]
MSNDALDSMIIAMKNAISGKAETVRVPATNITKNIVGILVEEGYLENLREHREGTNHLLVLTLGYKGRLRKPRITTLKRMSRPGLRVYPNHKDIPKVLGGMGTVILSTPGGTITDREARQKRIGGEVLFYVR